MALAHYLVSWLEGLSTVAQRQFVTMLRSPAAASTVRWSMAWAAASAGCGLLLLPAWRAQAGRAPRVIEGIETVDDAVEACRCTGLSGWELVTHAQCLVYRKFACYSCRNLWDTPAQAF